MDITHFPGNDFIYINCINCHRNKMFQMLLGSLTLINVEWTLQKSTLQNIYLDEFFSDNQTRESQLCVRENVLKIIIGF